MSSDRLLACILRQVSRYIYFDNGGFTFNLKSSLSCSKYAIITLKNYNVSLRPDALRSSLQR